MNYNQTLDWLFSQLPMYQRIGGAAYKIDLDNTIKLCTYLGNPEKGFKSIHIAGTNGKGSCAFLLAYRFQEAGYKVGLYTSPHLKDFRERIQINGEMIPQDQVIEFVEKNKNSFQEFGLSFFEMTVGMAFDYFNKEEVDIAIVEAGLGGRLDSTNVLQPELSIITNIGMDHMQFLGDDIPTIAAEKSGIIKKDIPALIGETSSETESVFQAKADEVGTQLFHAEEIIGPAKLLSYNPIALYQYKNLRTVLAALKIMRDRGWKVEDPKALDPWIGSGLLGRFQIIGKQPMTIVDGGHNSEGIESLMSSIADLEYESLWLVLGMVNDKEVEKSLSLFPETAHYIYCQADIPRALAAKELAIVGVKTDREGLIIPDVKEAISRARALAGTNDLVLVGGSFFVVAEAI